MEQSCDRFELWYYNKNLIEDMAINALYDIRGSFIHDPYESYQYPPTYIFSSKIKYLSAMSAVLDRYLHYNQSKWVHYM